MISFTYLDEYHLHYQNWMILLYLYRNHKDTVYILVGLLTQMSILFGWPENTWELLDIEKGVGPEFYQLRRAVVGKCTSLCTLIFHCLVGMVASTPVVPSWKSSEEHSFLSISAYTGTYYVTWKLILPWISFRHFVYNNTWNYIKFF